MTSAPPPPSPPPAPAPRILVVEDDPGLLQAVLQLVTQGGYQALSAADGHAALQLARTQRPVLVLLKMELPDLTGLEVLRQIKADPGLAEMSVVLLSTPRTAPDQLIAALEAGADSCIARPMADGEFLARVRTQLRQHDRVVQLRATGQQLRTVIDSAHDAFVTIDVTGRITDWNSQATILFGWTREEAIGQPLTGTIVPSRYRAAHQQGMQHFLATGEGPMLNRIIELNACNRKGREFPVELRIRAIRQEGTYVFVAFIRDVTERKKAEEAMRERELHFRDLFDDAPVGYHELDAEGRIVRVNRTELVLLGYTEGEMIGHPVCEFAADPAKSAAAVRAKLAGTVLVEGAFARQVRRKDGTMLEVLVTDRLIRDHTGRITGIRTMMQDNSARIRAEQTLRQEQQLFHDLINTIPDNIYFKDRQSRFVRINRTLAKTFGLATEADALGRTDADYFTAEHTRQAYEDEQNLMRTGEPIIGLEEKEIRHDGRVSWVSTTKMPLRDAQGAVTGLVGISRDITRSKLLEKSLQDEKNLFESLINSIPESIYFKDRASRFVRINEFLRQSIKVAKASDAIGKKDSDYFSGALSQQVYEDEQRLMNTGEPIIGQEEMDIQKDGRRTWVSSTKVPLRDELGHIYGLVGITRDITKSKLAQEKINQLSSAVEQSPVSIVITDLAGNIEYTNSRFTLVTGYTAEEAKGRNPRILKSGATPAETFAQLWQTITAGRTWRGEFSNKRKNGEHYWEEASISPICDANGKPTHYLAVKEDITARKQAEHDLQAAKEAAETAARAKSEFLANMSHEIRTPMNGVIGMTGLLLDTPLDAEQRQFAEAVRGSADNLMVVINDILDFSKIEAGKLTFEELDFDLVETIEGALDMLAERAQAKGIELLDALAPNLPSRLRGDPSRLRQILTNLLGNALKFTEHGEVVLRVALESETPTQAVVRFSVTDTGIGIPTHVQEKLFQSFSQADSSTTRKYGGTGLGLAISKQLVGLMHGEIGVESEEGRGAKFWFTARFEKQTGAPKPPRDGNQNLFDLRVLVVDDNATNRQILRHQIFAWKMQKGSAGGGHEALKLLREAAAAAQPYDVALLDMQMPEMDGMTLARAIKADPAIAATHLIMLTSLGHRFTKRELAAAGIDAYLVKPVKQSRLYDTLVDVIGDAKAARVLTETPFAPVPVAAPAPRSLRVLVAEDNQVNQKIASAQLGKLGCKVDVVANGLEVLEVLPRQKYDVILMDCQMPEMDGYEATQAIRKRECEPGRVCQWKTPIHIIAMTANAMEGDREKCLAAGMDDYVSKPVRLSELQAALARARAG